MPKMNAEKRLVAEVISLFVSMGCSLTCTSQPVEIEDGRETYIRHLVSPDKQVFFPIVDLSDDEFIFGEEIEHWERRLGVVIPKSDEIN